MWILKYRVFDNEITHQFKTIGDLMDYVQYSGVLHFSVRFDNTLAN